MRLTPVRVFVIGFGLVVLLGTLLLSLPIASRSGDWTEFSTAFFTATSASCVTGLIVVDTYSYWNFFGQTVILCLIQIGGLGFMTLFSLFSMLAHRTITLRERLVMQQSFNLMDVSGVVRITKRVMIGTALLEGSGALILTVKFAKEYGFLGGLYRGIFHSVSAFCNAGFDLMGDKAAFSSLTRFADDTVVNLVIMALIVMGGLGFFVWDDFVAARCFKKLQVYSKIVIVTSTILIFGGALLFFAFEWWNPATLGGLSPKGRVLASLFQSVTARTAGFNTIDQSSMTPPSQLLTTLLMFIGGSSGSTAGGIKTATFALLMLTGVQVIKGRHNVEVFGRRLNNDYVLRALSLTVISLSAVGISMLAVFFTNAISLSEVVYECFSAFGTVGMTLGITTELNLAGRLVIICLMFFGRVGVMSLLLALVARMNASSDHLRYPEVRAMIG